MNALTARTSAPWQTPPADNRSGSASDFEPGGTARGSFVITLLCLYIFLLSSRVLDISRIAILHIPLILLGLLTVATLAKGDLKYALRSKTTLWFIALNAWVCFCFPFSRWRGGSMPFIVTSLESLCVYFWIVQLIRTRKQWRAVAKVYALGVLVAAILSIFFGRSIDGRVSVVEGSLADPNEFALRLVLGLPFWWYLASQLGIIGKIGCFLLTTPIFVSFARAGSRSALLALVALFGIMFLFVNVKQKAVMAAAAVVALAAGVALLPAYLKVRFTTLFMPHDASRLSVEERTRLGGDIGSTESREMLLFQAMRMTVQHPLVGIGPGVFGDVAWNQRKADSGIGGGLLVTHNTYTQFSSETGIPGFVCFLGTLLTSLLFCFSDYRRNRERDPSIAKASLYMFVCLVGLAAGIFFLSVGYGMLLAVLFGLAASLHLVVASETTDAQIVSPSEPALQESPIAAARPKLRENRVNGRRVRFGRFAVGERSSSRPRLH